MDLQTKKQRLKYYLLIMGISLAVTCLTVLFPCGVDSAEDLRNLRFGLPFPYIEQAGTSASHTERFPAFINIDNPMKSPTRFKPVSFVCDFFIFTQIVMALRYMIISRKRLRERE